MSRNAPEECPSPPKADAWKDYESRTSVVQLVTPMFGGGVGSGHPDPVTLIRPTSIRGHLRFWWRVTRGARFKSVSELKRYETVIWGDTEFPSPVWVSVERVDTPRDRYRRPPTYGFAKFGAEAYALFSAKQNNSTLCKEGIKFELTLRWPKQARFGQLLQAENRRRRETGRRDLLPELTLEEELMAALTAWLNFGGLGARTRRGCGALHCRDQLIRPPRSMPGVRVLRKKQQAEEALDAWMESIKVYQAFRQGFRGPLHRKTLRSGKPVEVPGRSYWPEADSIRNLTGCALAPGLGTHYKAVDPGINTVDHRDRIVPEELLPAFPRAALGLPIIFHFADGPGRDKEKRPRPAVPHLDPTDVELLPVPVDDHGNPIRKDHRVVTFSRMASPVITRPLHWHNHWYAGLIILDHSQLGSFGALLRGNRARIVNARVADLEEFIPASKIVGTSLNVLKPMQERDNALDAFIAFANKPENGFEEVL